jgi:hypothetical protein
MLCHAPTLKQNLLSTPYRQSQVFPQYLECNTSTSKLTGCIHLHRKAKCFRMSYKNSGAVFTDIEMSQFPASVHSDSNERHLITVQSASWLQAPIFYVNHVALYAFSEYPFPFTLSHKQWYCHILGYVMFG